MATQAYGPGTSASNQAASQASSEPKWTTGQGIGFLVSLCGWLIAAAGLIGLMITAPAGAGDDELVPIFGLLAGLGVISAIPGTIVFHKCKRREAGR